MALIQEASIPVFTTALKYILIIFYFLIFLKFLYFLGILKSKDSKKKNVNESGGNGGSINDPNDPEYYKREFLTKIKKAKKEKDEAKALLKKHRKHKSSPKKDLEIAVKEADKKTKKVEALYPKATPEQLRELERILQEARKEIRLKRRVFEKYLSSLDKEKKDQLVNQISSSKQILAAAKAKYESIEELDLEHEKDFEDAINELENNINDADKELNKDNPELENAENDLLNSTAKVNQLIQDIEREIKNSEDNASAEKDDEELKQELEDLKEKTKTIDDKLSNIQDHFADLIQVIDDLQKQTAEGKEDKGIEKEIKKDIEDIKQEIKDLKDKKEEINQKAEEIEKKLGEDKKKHPERKQEIEEAKKEVNNVLEEIEEIKEDVNRRVNSATEVGEILTKRTELDKDVIKKINNLKKEFHEFNTLCYEKTSIKKKTKNLEKQVNLLERDKKELDNKIEELEELIKDIKKNKIKKTKEDEKTYEDYFKRGYDETEKILINNKFDKYMKKAKAILKNVKEHDDTIKKIKGFKVKQSDCNLKLNTYWKTKELYAEIKKIKKNYHKLKEIINLGVEHISSTNTDVMEDQLEEERIPDSITRSLRGLNENIDRLKSSQKIILQLLDNINSFTNENDFYKHIRTNISHTGKNHIEGYIISDEHKPALIKPAYIYLFILKLQDNCKQYHY